MAKVEYFKIEKNLSIPGAIQYEMRYPWLKEMEIDDSVLVPPENITDIRSNISQYGRRHQKKFLTRKANGGYRIWRVE